MPFLFLIHPGLLLEGGVLTIVTATVAAMLGITALAGVLQRYFFGALQLWQMAVAAGGSDGHVYDENPVLDGGSCAHYGRWSRLGSVGGRLTALAG